jgi:predicted kinase
MLYIFAGLPASGKTTLAKRLAQKCGATYIRVDTIEDALKASTLNIHPAEDAGYVAGCALATENLQLGQSVIVDSVNPIALTREWWRNAALQADTPFIEIEVICSDIDTHKGRISDRGWDWSRVVDREYEVFEGDIIQIDTAFVPVDQSFRELLGKLGEIGE